MSAAGMGQAQHSVYLSNKNKFRVEGWFRCKDRDSAEEIEVEELVD